MAPRWSQDERWSYPDISSPGSLAGNTPLPPKFYISTRDGERKREGEREEEKGRETERERERETNGHQTETERERERGGGGETDRDIDDVLSRVLCFCDIITLEPSRSTTITTSATAQLS